MTAHVQLSYTAACFDSAAENNLHWLQNEWCTCVMVGVGDSVAGVLSIKDPLKPEARGVVAALHQAGMACHLVTGDNWRTARSIAEQLGIINVSAECLPANKAEKIKVCTPGNV